MSAPSFVVRHGVESALLPPGPHPSGSLPSSHAPPLGQSPSGSSALHGTQMCELMIEKKLVTSRSRGGFRGRSSSSGSVLQALVRVIKGCERTNERKSDAEPGKQRGDSQGYWKMERKDEIEARKERPCNLNLGTAVDCGAILVEGACTSRQRAARDWALSSRKGGCRLTASRGDPSKYFLGNPMSPLPPPPQGCVFGDMCMYTFSCPTSHVTYVRVQGVAS